MTAIGAFDLRETIAHAISDELDRQSRSGASRIDIDAMASAIERNIDRGMDRPARIPPRVQMRQAKRPDQLNAQNDG